MLDQLEDGRKKTAGMENDIAALKEGFRGFKTEKDLIAVLKEELEVLKKENESSMGLLLEVHTPIITGILVNEIVVKIRGRNSAGPQGHLKP